MSIDQIIKEKLIEILSDTNSKEIIRELVKDCLAQNSSTQEYLTRYEAAQYLRVCVSTIDNYVSRGLKKIKIGHSTRIKKSDLEAFIQNKHPP